MARKSNRVSGIRLSPLLIRLAAAFCLVALLGASILWFHQWRVMNAIQRSEELSKQGYLSLALSALEPHTSELTRDQKGCEKILAAAYAARHMDQLANCAESCMSNGVSIPPTYLGLSLSREQRGDLAGAVQILTKGTSQYPKDPDLIYGLAQVQRKLGNDRESAIAYKQLAAIQESTSTAKAEALVYLSELGNWSDALPIAESLATLSELPLQARLATARVFIRSGNTGRAEAIVHEVRSKLPGLPPGRAEIFHREFSDVLGSVKKDPKFESLIRDLEKAPPPSAPLQQLFGDPTRQNLKKPTQ